MENQRIARLNKSSVWGKAYVDHWDKETFGGPGISISVNALSGKFDIVHIAVGKNYAIKNDSQLKHLYVKVENVLAFWADHSNSTFKKNIGDTMSVVIPMTCVRNTIEKALNYTYSRVGINPS